MLGYDHEVMSQDLAVGERDLAFINDQVDLIGVQDYHQLDGLAA